MSYLNAVINNEQLLIEIKNYKIILKLLLNTCTLLNVNCVCLHVIVIILMYLLTSSLSIRQSCVLVAVSLITSEQFCESYSDELDNVVLANLSLMLLGYHGNSECGHILKIVSESSLSKCHPLLRNLNTIAINEG